MALVRTLVCQRTFSSVRRKASFQAPLVFDYRFTHKRRRDSFGSRCFASSFNEDFSKEHQDVVITYLTDVEGDKAYLDRYVQNSKVLQFCEASEDFPYDQCISFKSDNSMLIYGGDVWDKGGFDLYVIRQLLDLKRRYPNRVQMIMGNRDIVKLRILQELGVMNTEKLPEHPGLLWLKGTGRVGDPDSSPPPKEPVERLKWILSQTMGSPQAFEHRLNELQSENKNLNITDMDVVRSYQLSCHPQGELGQYLSKANLVIKLGPILVVHGSLPLTEDAIVNAAKKGQKSVWDDLTFCMPWILPGESAKENYGVTSIDEWLEALNQFGRDRVQNWKDEIKSIEEGKPFDPNVWAYKAGYHNGPTYSALIQYGMGMKLNRKQNPTVVYNSFTPKGMPHKFFPNAEGEYLKYTKEFFDRARIQLVLAGHKPQGDMPNPIRVDSSAWVLCCDTSYSGDTIWYDDDNVTAKEAMRTNSGQGKASSFRGDVAVSEVLLELGAFGSMLKSVKYHGVLSDGTEYETINLLDHGENSMIGQVAPDHLVPSEKESPHQGRWWLKSVFSDGSHLFYAGEGFDVWNFVSKPPP